MLSFAQLRKLRFPVDGNETPAMNASARAVVASLGVLALALQLEDGYQLRSRCQLVPVAEPEFEWLGVVASDKATSHINAAAARDAFTALYARAKKRRPGVAGGADYAHARR